MRRVREHHRIVLLRHGETAWSANRRHTGRSDIPLDAEGRASAAAVADLLRGWDFALELSSPLSRAWDTARLAGLDPVPDDDLLEWDYGEYEGLATEEIRTAIPGWSVWTHDVVGGESVDQVGARADRVIERATARRRRRHPRRARSLPPRPRRSMDRAAARPGPAPHARHLFDVGAWMGARDEGDPPLEHSPASDPSRPHLTRHI